MVLDARLLDDGDTAEDDTGSSGRFVDAPGVDGGADEVTSDIGMALGDGGKGAYDSAAVVDLSRPTSAALVVDRTVVNLGALDLYAPGVVTLTVTNWGGATSGVVDIGATEGLLHKGCRRELAAGTSCTLTITAIATATGPFSGTVSIMASPGAEPPLVVTIEATATAEIFTVSPQLLNVGALRSGTLVPTITITALTDLSDLTLTSSNSTILPIARTDCGKSLGEGASCAVSLVAAPLSSGGTKTSLVVSAAGKIVTVVINIQNGASFWFGIDPNDVQIFVVTPELPNPARTFTITGGPAEAIVVEIGGPDAADFVVASNDCVILPAGGKCTVTVAFVPSMDNPLQTRGATLTVTDREAPAQPASVSLVGSLSASPGLIVAPASIDLGSVRVGTEGDPTSLEVVNLATAATGPLVISLPSQEFTFWYDGCRGESLAAGASCTISLRLAPVTLGPITGILTVGDGVGASAVARLTGLCVAAVDAGMAAP